jgi:mRNA interferase RelE/StbE
MNKIDKFLKKIPKKDRILIEQALKLIFKGHFQGLDLKKLKGYDSIFRIRIGNYRIIFFNDGEGIILKAMKKRDESTYHDF